MQPKVKLIVAICTLLVVIAIVVFAVTQPARTARRELEAKLVRDTKAMEAKDVDTLLDGMMPNVTVKDLRGKVRNYAELEKNYRRNIASFDTIQVSSKIDSLVLNGSKATETLTQTLNGTLRDSRNRSHTIQDTNKTRVVLVRTATGWKTEFGEILAESVTLDGKTTALKR